MRTRWLLVLLGLLCIGQWSVPGALILKHQRTLSNGAAYAFRTAPVDPEDPFRGRYVALDFAAAERAATSTAPLPHDVPLYAAITVDAQGFAQLGEPASTPPAQGDWLPVRVTWQGEGRVRLQLPFDRFYLDEALAPEAERRYREADQGPASRADATYVMVRVRDGHAVIEMLYLNGRPVHVDLAGAIAGR